MNKVQQYGDEYPIPEIEEDIKSSKENHPEAFIDGTPENELRKDLNLIWYTYDVKNEDYNNGIDCGVEMFWIMFE